MQRDLRSYFMHHLPKSHLAFGLVVIGNISDIRANGLKQSWFAWKQLHMAGRRSNHRNDGGSIGLALSDGMTGLSRRIKSPLVQRQTNEMLSLLHRERLNLHKLKTSRES